MPQTTVETLIYKLEVDDKANAVFAKTADNLDGLQTSFKKITGTTSKFSGVAVSAFKSVANSVKSFTVDAGKNFAIYEDALSHARRTMGLTREETLDLGDALIALSTSFEENGLQAGVSANELAKIAGQLGQLGYSARDDVDGFKELVSTVAKVSVAFGMTSAKAAESLGILQNLYGFTQNEFSNVASSIAYLGNTTVATAGQILDIMTRVGGIAGILGVSAQQMAGISATLREAGVSAQVGGTAMSQIFSRLSSDVDKFGEVLGEGGLSGEMLRFKIESGDATGALRDVLQAIQTINATQGKIAAIQALKDLGLQGVRVQQTLLALSNNIGGLNENLAKSEEAFQANTAVNDAYQAAIDNTAQKWNQFQNLLDAITKMIGKDVSLAFSNFLEKHLIPFTDHFKNWIETSATVDKIFGENGYFAQGLNYVGTLLTDNENAIFGWLDNIDKALPALLDALKAVLAEVFAQVALEIEPVITQFQTLADNINASAEAITALANTAANLWDKITGPLNAWREFVKDNREDLGKYAGIIAGPMRQGIADLITETDGLTKTMAGYTEGIKAGEQAMQEFGITAMYRSVLPDITKGTIQAAETMRGYQVQIGKTTDTTKFLYETSKNGWTNLNREVQSGTDRWQSGMKAVAATFDNGRVSTENFRDGVLAIDKNILDLSKQSMGYDVTVQSITDHTKFLYQTAENTWSNINREIQSGTDRWQRMGEVAADSQYFTQFALQQTGDAVNNLDIQMADMLQKMYLNGERALIPLQKIEDWAVTLPNKAAEAVNAVMATTQSSLQNIGSLTNLSGAQLTDLQRSGILAPSLNANRLINSANASMNGLPQINTSMPAMPTGGMPSSMNVQLVVGDQEIGNLVGVIDTKKQQQAQRSFGGTI